MPAEDSPIRILFVCWGNICRSPAAECVMRHLIRENGDSDRVQCDSAGTMDLHAGHLPDKRMRATAAARGITINGAAREIRPEDFHSFDLIVAMDNENRMHIEKVRAKVENPAADVRQFCEFVESTDHTEVPDPYYGGQRGFDLVMDLLEDGCRNLLTTVTR